MCAFLENFSQASQWYSALAEDALSNPTMKYSAKNYLFNSCICTLALNDEVTARRALEKASASDPLFANQPHSMLINDLIVAMFENEDPSEFSQRILQFEIAMASKFDDYQISALLAAKKAILEADEEYA